jgi:hypothetical protein
MGLSDADVKAITLGWSDTMAAVETAILKNNGYTWSLIPKQQYANAAPTMLSSDPHECTAELANACLTTSVWQNFPVLFGFTTKGTELPQLKQDLAFFLLARGPFAYVRSSLIHATHFPARHSLVCLAVSSLFESGCVRTLTCVFSGGLPLAGMPAGVCGE